MFIKKACCQREGGVSDLHRVLSVQLALRTQVGEELTTWDVLHEEEKVAGVLSEPL